MLCSEVHTEISSQIGIKLRDWAVWQARAGRYSQAALSSNDSKTLYYYLPECEFVLDAVLELPRVRGLELVVGQVVKVARAELVELGPDVALPGGDARRRLVRPLQLAAPHVHVPVGVDSINTNLRSIYRVGLVV